MPLTVGVFFDSIVVRVLVVVGVTVEITGVVRSNSIKKTKNRIEYT